MTATIARSSPLICSIESWRGEASRFTDAASARHGHIAASGAGDRLLDMGVRSGSVTGRIERVHCEAEVGDGLEDVMAQPDPGPTKRLGTKPRAMRNRRSDPILGQW